MRWYAHCTGPPHSAPSAGLMTVAVSRDRRPLEDGAEDERQDEADPHRVGGDADEDEDHRAAVENRPRLQRPTGRRQGSRRGARGSAPPKTSEAVTGAAEKTMSFTSWRLTNDRPSEPLEDELLHPEAVLLPHRLVEVEVLRDLLDLLGGGGLARCELGRVVRRDEEDDVRDERDGEEEEHRPQQSAWPRIST